jgi:hypothetical protein
LAAFLAAFFSSASRFCKSGMVWDAAVLGSRDTDGTPTIEHKGLVESNAHLFEFLSLIQAHLGLCPGCCRRGLVLQDNTACVCE